MAKAIYTGIKVNPRDLRETHKQRVNPAEIPNCPKFSRTNPGIISQIAENLRDGNTVAEAIPPRLRDTETAIALHKSS